MARFTNQVDSYIGNLTIESDESGTDISGVGVISLRSTAAPGWISLSAYEGAYVNGISPEKKIATIGDIPTAPVDTAFTVAGGTAGTQPTFSSAPLFTGSYVKHGDSVTFRVNVAMTNITSFGTGQYYIDLPFVSKYGILMRDGCLHDASNSNQWSISGHVFAGESRLHLWYTSGTGQDEAFDHNSPITLTTADTFHVSGTYISA